MNYDFEWDPDKARANRRKHGVGFEDATTVFKDSRALSVYDDAHSAAEERWITLGFAATGALLAVHHTFIELDADTVVIRIFSCRRATRREISSYTE